ncbi:polysaccharide deacetylase family protein [Salinicoccus sp. Marseille-QA3877]
MTNIDYTHINKEDLIKNEKQVFNIYKNDKCYKTLVNLTKDRENIVVFFSNNIENTLQNCKEKESINQLYFSYIIIEDLTATENNLLAGFGIGNQNIHYVREYKEIIEKITDEINISNNNVYFYGEYENGFISIILSILLENSTAIVHNPVNFVQRIDEMNKKELYNTLFPKLSNDEIIKQNLKKFSTTVHMRKTNIAPQIFYLQNEYDRSYKSQCIPFLSNLEKYKIHDGNIIKLFYNNEDSVGHNLSSHKFQNLISSVLKINNLQYMDDNVYYNSKASLVLLDDDCREESYNILYKYGQKNKIPITFGVNSGHIINKTKKRMSIEQFEEMAHDTEYVEFVNHTHSHVKLTELSNDEIEKEIKLCQEFLESYGIFTRHLIYPFGKVNEGIIDLASKYVDSGSKTEGRIVNPEDKLFNPFLLNRIAFESNLDKIENNILKAIDSNGFVIINIHSQYDTFSIEKLEKILRLCKKYKIDILHLSEAIKRLDLIK